MVLPDVFHGFLHDCQKVRVNLGKSLLDLSLSHADVVCRQLCSVKFFCIFKKGFIASGADIVHDCLYGVLIGAVVIWVTL